MRRVSGQARAIVAGGAKVKPSLSGARNLGKKARMAPPSPKPPREEILAAKLRENLKRRKAQARSLARSLTGTPAADASALPKGESNG